MGCMQHVQIIVAFNAKNREQASKHEQRTRVCPSMDRYVRGYTSVLVPIVAVPLLQIQQH